MRWVPALRGFSGNEYADLLAKLGACRPFIGPELFPGMPWCIIKACMKKWLFDKQRRYWKSCTNMKHTQKFDKDLESKRSKAILGLKRNEIRLVTGFMTGHYPLKPRLKKMRLSDDDLCRYCLEESETAEHLLCDCVA